MQKRITGRSIGGMSCRKITLIAANHRTGSDRGYYRSTARNCSSDNFVKCFLMGIFVGMKKDVSIGGEKQTEFQIKE